MQAPPLPFNPQGPSSSATTTNSGPAFIETLEYRRFVEFCDACRRDRYIGLCFGPPGIGKTLSAWHYSRAELIVPLDRWSAEARDQKPIDTVLYTINVINSPSRVEVELHRAREILSNIATRAIRTEARLKLDAMRLRDENWRKEHREDPTYVPARPPPFTPTYFETFEESEAKKRAIPDPTSLIVIDEADRLSMPSLEQLRSVFDQTGVVMVLIGMPGSRSEPHVTRSSSRASASCTNSGRSRLRRCKPFLRRTGRLLSQVHWLRRPRRMSSQPSSESRAATVSAD
jgi:hypothetical protein